MNDYLTEENLAGVVVIYNPDTDIVRNITTYISHVSLLYVIDNSELPNEQIINKIKCLSTKIVYKSFNSNLGIAKALNEGCKQAYESGFKWILTMDQDSFFLNESFFSESMNNNYPNVSIIAASHDDVHFKPKLSANPLLIEVGFAITSGNLLNLEVWILLGGFTEKLFIDEVDNDFCVRSKNNGFKIFTTVQVVLAHRLGDSFTVKNFFTAKKYSISKHSPLRVYYMCRNNLYMWRKYFFSNTGLVFNRIKKVLLLFIKIVAYFPDKKIYLKFFFNGLLDSIKGRYGKFVN